jgi:predicted secreted hydrolase
MKPQRTGEIVNDPTRAKGLLEGLDSETLQSVADALWQRELDLSAIPAEVAEALGSEANSAEAYGRRMHSFLKYLIEHPVDHTPSYEKTYEYLLPFSTRLSAQQAYVMSTKLLGPPASVGYDMVPNKANFEFPRDFGPKQRSAVGWHFFIGSCWDEDGAEYGVELMFFQAGLFPPPLAAGFGLTEDENQVVELQLAISKAGERHWQADPVCLGGTSGLVSHTANPFSYHLGRNSMVCHDADEFFPMTVTAGGVDRGEAPPRELSIDITFTSGKQYLYQGANGCMPAADGVGSLYYSIPNIELDSTCSTLTLDGRTVRLVRGQFWFDRQWGFLSGAPRSKVMRAAKFSKNAEPEGWDWFMAQFTDDRQITVFAPHDHEDSEFYAQTGPEKPATMTRRVGGTYIDAKRDQSMTWGTLRVTDWIKAVTSPNPQRYPVTDTWYPNQWEFEFDEVVPEDIRRVTMTPIVQVAQVGFFANGSQYAEGAVVLTDPNGTDIGRGFAESVAYANTVSTTYRLAGLPDSQSHHDVLSHLKIPTSLALLNTAYVLAHQTELAEVLSESVGLEFFTPSG